jgi:hypothetical protein
LDRIKMLEMAIKERSLFFGAIRENENGTT